MITFNFVQNSHISFQQNAFETLSVEKVWYILFKGQYFDSPCFN